MRVQRAVKKRQHAVVPKTKKLGGIVKKMTRGDPKNSSNELVGQMMAGSRCTRKKKEM